MSNAEVYRFIGNADLDDSQVQFNITEKSDKIYLNFSLLSNLDIPYAVSILEGTLVVFEQDKAIVGVARISEQYDEDDGFELEEMPKPALVSGQIYSIGFTQGRPGTSTAQLIPGPSGWTPDIVIDSDGNREVFQIVRWIQSGDSPPAVGYIGASGLTSDIAQAIDLRGPSGLEVIPTFALNTEYIALEPFVDSGILYRSLERILDTNTDDVDTLLAASKIELIAGLTVEQTAILTRVGGIDIRDFRSGVPSAPDSSQTAAFALAKKAIGIGNHGILWTFEHTDQSAPTTTWQDFENEHWEFEQTQELPQAAVETGDFWYIPNGGTGPGRGVWQVYDGTKVVDYYDAIDAFLPNHIFLGNFSSQQAAANAISSYDSNKTYLAYFPTVVEGRAGREVQQLASYTAGNPAANQWVSSDEELHKIILHLETSINIVNKNFVTVSEEIAQQDQKIIENRNNRIPIRTIRSWIRDTGSGTLSTGTYRADEDTIILHHIATGNFNVASEIGKIEVNQGLRVGSDKYFIITEITGYTNYTEFSGKWVGEREDTAANGAIVNIDHITRNINYGEWVIADEIIGLESGNVTQAAIYAELKKIVKQGSNITITYDDTNHTITVASSGGGGASFNILAGDGPPASNLGNDGDFYREKDDGTVWRKASGNWVEVIDLATEDELAIVRVALQAVENQVDRIESEFETVRYDTPHRVTSMPAHVEEFELVVLTEDSHGGEDVYDFDADEATYNQNNEYYNYWGANVVNFGAKLPLIGSGLPTIFRDNRVVALYQVQAEVGTLVQQKLKVIVRTGLLNATSLTDEETKIAIRVPQIGHQVYTLKASTFDDTGNATRTLAGQSYSIYETAEPIARGLISLPANNNAKISFQISQEVSGVRQFLSDDNTTIWATGIEYTEGLYQGNSSRKPVEVEIIPKDTIKELKNQIANVDTGEGPIFTARAERVYFNNLDDISSTEQSAVIRSATPIDVRHGTGVNNLIGTISGQTGQLQVLKRGIYELHLDGVINIEGSGNARRSLPRVRVYHNSNLVAEVDDHYHRTGSDAAQRNDQNVSGDGIIYVPTDNYVVTFGIANEIQNDGADFDIESGWSITFTPFGVKGDKGDKGEAGTAPDVSNFRTESQITTIADNRAKARYTDTEKTKLGGLPTTIPARRTDTEINNLADARAKARYTDAEKTKLAGLSSDGGGGITEEENKFEWIDVPGGQNAYMAFRTPDFFGLPAEDQFPRNVAGGGWEYSYYAASGKTFYINPTGGSGNFTVRLLDLGGIRGANRGDEVEGTTFLIVNGAPTNGRTIAFQGSGLATIIPTTATIPPQSAAIVSFTPVGTGSSQTYRMLVSPLGGGSGEVDKETLYGTGTPAGTLGTIGDSYINTTNAKFYVKTGSSSWTERVDLATQAELDAKVTDADVNILSASGESTTVAPSRQSVAEMGANLKTAADNAKSAADTAQLAADAAIGYRPSWAAGAYKQGSIVTRSGEEYIATAAIVTSDPAPNASTNTKWVQISNTNVKKEIGRANVNVLANNRSVFFSTSIIMPTGFNKAGIFYILEIKNENAIPLILSGEDIGSLTASSAGSTIVATGASRTAIAYRNLIGPLETGAGSIIFIGRTSNNEILFATADTQGQIDPMPMIIREM